MATDQNEVFLRVHCAHGSIHLSPHDGRGFEGDPNTNGSVATPFAFGELIDGDQEFFILMTPDGKRPYAAITGPEAVHAVNCLTVLGGILAQMTRSPEARQLGRVLNSRTTGVHVPPRGDGADAGAMNDAAQGVIADAIKAGRNG